MEPIELEMEVALTPELVKRWFSVLDPLIARLVRVALDLEAARIALADSPPPTDVHPFLRYVNEDVMHDVDEILRTLTHAKVQLIGLDLHRLADQLVTPDRLARAEEIVTECEALRRDDDR